MAQTAEALTRAYRELFQGRQHGLQELLAVVFDGQAVIYGLADLRRALGGLPVLRAGSQ